MIHRHLVEQALPPDWVVMIRDACQRLGLPAEQWPTEMVELLDCAVLARAEELGSQERACEELEVSYTAFRQRQLRRRARTATL
jgi:hypothetical protein